MEKEPRRLNWGVPAGPPSRRPLRDAALLYGVLALAIVLFGVATGAALRALATAAVFYVLAVGWTAWRLRARRRKRGTALP